MVPTTRGESIELNFYAFILLLAYGLIIPYYILKIWGLIWEKGVYLLNYVFRGLILEIFAIEYMYIYSIVLTLDLSYLLTFLTGVGKLLFWLPNGANVTESLCFQ